MASMEIASFETSIGLNDDERRRIKAALGTFREATGIEAKYCIKSPGRVNLIGDHIDYHGFSVIPMAIENSILLCLSTSKHIPDKLVEHTRRPKQNDQQAERRNLIILNVDSDRFPTHSCGHSLAHGGSLDQNHEWYNYVLCGYHGVLATQLLQVESEQVFEQAKRFEESVDPEQLEELDNIVVLVDSNLPPASGLSSSSALVCASAIATHLALNEPRLLGPRGDTNSLMLNSETLASDCAKYEHLVGTRGGGMDQAVILTAQKGYAKHVSFVPRLASRNLILPQDVVWLISHCGVSHHKASTCQFNARVLETKLGAALILRTLKPSSTLTIDHTITLRRVKDELVGQEGSSAAALISLIEERVFEEAPEMSIDTLCTKLVMSRSELIERFKTSEKFLEESGLGSRLQLLRRCRHVFEESDRVDQFVRICETTRDIKRLGELMTESHISLRDNYQCSDPMLDEIVEAALGAGGLGARLTGAGWGGSTVTLVESCKAQQVIERLKQVSVFTFRTEPQSGTTIFKFV